jgi:Rrf2 family protein
MDVANPPERSRVSGAREWPTAKSTYALRACIALAAAEPGERLKTAEIAMQTSVPARFLSKILGELRTAGILTARRGHNGGYSLARRPDEIRVDELLRAVGARDLFSPPGTSHDAPVPFVDALRLRLHAITVEALHNISLAELTTTLDANFTTTPPC